MANLNYQANASLVSFHTFGCEASCRWLVAVEDLSELVEALQWAHHQDLPVLLLGEGSNLIFTANVPGLVIRMALKGIRVVEQDEQSALVEVDAGENWHGWLQWCLDQGFYGLENLALIPGTVGAAPVQNIGAYGVEQSSCFDSAQVLDSSTMHTRWLGREECHFGYRESLFKQPAGQNLIIVSVRYRLTKKAQMKTDYQALRDWLDQAGINEPSPQQVFSAVCEIRKSKLPDPDVVGNAGSFFKNPCVSAACHQALLSRYPDLVSYPQANGEFKIAAGWMIDHLGWKGKSLGEVAVHDRQALVLVNKGHAQGQDVLCLAEAIRSDVEKAFGVSLEIEPRLYP